MFVINAWKFLLLSVVLPMSSWLNVKYDLLKFKNYVYDTQNYMYESFNNIKQLQLRRKENTYTKKGLKINNSFFKMRTGKKTTYA